MEETAPDPGQLNMAPHHLHMCGELVYRRRRRGGGFCSSSSEEIGLTFTVDGTVDDDGPNDRGQRRKLDHELSPDPVSRRGGGWLER